MTFQGRARLVANVVRVIVWIVLIVGGTVAVFTLLWRGAETGAVVAAGVATVFTWFVWNWLTGLVFGLRGQVRGHLRSGWERVEVLKHPVPRRTRADLQIALDFVRERDPRPEPVYGVGETNLTRVVRINAEPQPIEWEQFPSGLDRTMRCATTALYLLRYKGQPYVAMVHPGSGSSGGEYGIRRRRGGGGVGFELEVAARTREVAEGAMAELLDLASAKSVHRGAVITVDQPRAEDGDADEPFVVRFAELARVERDRVVLPEDVMRVVERNVLGLLEHRDVLRRARRSTRHGVLLHGPPGVGKTLVTKYLARAVPGYTVILLTGRNLKFVRESCRVARLLAPAMVVMEDVDLVAAERRRNRNTTLLHELMDEMDGQGPQGDVIFLLTTNRPEILEPALAARPGRIDQAIYFPLPDHEGRRRLFGLFARGLDLAAVDVENLLTRTEGASPAFIEELFRKAALLAAERGERSDPLQLRTTDFESALRELLEFGGDLTRSLLGFRPPPPPPNA